MIYKKLSDGNLKPIYVFYKNNIDNKMYARGELKIEKNGNYYINNNYGEIVFYVNKTVIKDKAITDKINNNNIVNNIIGKREMQFLKNQYNSAFLYNSQFTYLDISRYYQIIKNYIPISLIDFEKIFPDLNRKYTISDMYIIIYNLLNEYYNELKRHGLQNLKIEDKNLYLNLHKLFHKIKYNGKNKVPILRYFKYYNIIVKNEKERLDTPLTKQNFLKHLHQLFNAIKRMKRNKNEIK